MKPMIIVQVRGGELFPPLSQIGCRLHPLPPPVAGPGCKKYGQRDEYLRTFIRIWLWKQSLWLGNMTNKRSTVKIHSDTSPFYLHHLMPGLVDVCSHLRNYTLFHLQQKKSQESSNLVLTVLPTSFCDTFVYIKVAMNVSQILPNMPNFQPIAHKSCQISEPLRR